jgi:hypothetical protein
VKPEVFDSLLANLSFLSGNLYPAFHKRENIQSIQSSQVGSANRRSSMSWRNVQPYWSAKKAFRSDVKAVPKIVGEFLKPCGN